MNTDSRIVSFPVKNFAAFRAETNLFTGPVQANNTREFAGTGTFQAASFGLDAEQMLIPAQDDASAADGGAGAVVLTQITGAENFQGRRTAKNE